MRKKKFNQKLTMIMALCLGLCFSVIIICGALSTLTPKKEYDDDASLTNVSEYNFDGVLDENTGDNKELRLSTASVETNTVLGAAQLKNTKRTYFMRAGEVMNDVIIANENTYFWDPMPSADIVGFFGQYSAGKEQRFKFYARIPGKTTGILHFADPNNATSPWFTIEFEFVVRLNVKAFDLATAPQNRPIANRMHDLDSTKYEFNVNDIAMLPDGVPGASMLGIIAASVRYPGAVDASAYATYDIGVACTLTASTGIGIDYFKRLGIDSRNLYYKPFGIEFLVKNFEPGQGGIGIITCYFNTYAEASQFVATPVELRSIDPLNEAAYGATLQGSAQSTFKPYTTKIYENQPAGSQLDFLTTSIGGPNETGRNNYWHSIVNASGGTTAIDGMGAEYYSSGQSNRFDVVMHHTQNYKNVEVTPAKRGCVLHGAVSPDQTIEAVTKMHIPNKITCTVTGSGTSGFFMCKHNYLSQGVAIFEHIYSAETDKIQCTASMTYPGLNSYRYCSHGFAVLSNKTETITHYNPNHVPCYYDGIIPAVYFQTLHNYNTVPFYFAAGVPKANFPESATNDITKLKSVKVNANITKVYLNNPSELNNLTNIKTVADTDDNNYAEIENIYAFDSAYFTASLIKNKSKSCLNIVGLQATTADNPKYLVITVKNVIAGQIYRRLFSIKVEVDGTMPQNNPNAYLQPNNAPSNNTSEHGIQMRTLYSSRLNTGLPLHAGRTNTDSIAVDENGDDFAFYETNASKFLYDQASEGSQVRANTVFFVTKENNSRILLTPKSITYGTDGKPGYEKFYVKVTDVNGADGFIEISAYIYNRDPVFRNDVEKVTLLASPASATPGGPGASTFSFSIDGGSDTATHLYNFATDVDEYPSQASESVLVKDTLTMEFYDWAPINENYLTRSYVNPVSGRAGARTLVLTAKKRATGLKVSFMVYDGLQYVRKDIIVDINNSPVEPVPTTYAGAQFITLINEDNNLVRSGSSMTLSASNIGRDFDKDELRIAEVKVNVQPEENNGLEEYVIKDNDTRTGGYIKATINLDGTITFTAIARSTKHPGYTGDGDFAVQIRVQDSGELNTQGGLWVKIPVKVTSSAPVENTLNTTVSGVSGFVSDPISADDLAIDLDGMLMDFVVDSSSDSRYADVLKFSSINPAGLRNYAELTMYNSIDDPTTSVSQATHFRIKLLRFTPTSLGENSIAVSIRIADKDGLYCDLSVNVSVGNTAPVYRYKTEDEIGTNPTYHANTQEGISYGTQQNPIIVNLALNNPDPLVNKNKVVIGVYDYIDDIDLQKDLNVGENNNGKPNVRPDGSPNELIVDHDFLSLSAEKHDVSNNELGYISITGKSDTAVTIQARIRNYGESPILIRFELLDSTGSIIPLYVKVMVYNSPPRMRETSEYYGESGKVLDLVVRPEYIYEDIIEYDEVEGREIIVGVKESIKENTPPKYIQLNAFNILTDDDVDSIGVRMDTPRFLSEYVLVKNNTLFETNPTAIDNRIPNPEEYIDVSVVDNGGDNFLRIEALKSTRYLGTYLWLGFYASDGTADNLPAELEINKTFYKSNVMWLKICIKNSDIYQVVPPSVQNFDKSIPSSATADDYFHVMIRAQDSITRAQFGSTKSAEGLVMTTAGQVSKTFKQNDTNAPLFIIADDYDRESIYLRYTYKTLNTNFYGLNSSITNSNILEITYFYKNTDGWTQGIASEALNNREWYVILTFKTSARGSIAFYLSDTSAESGQLTEFGKNNDTGEKISEFIFNFKLASYDVLKCYNGETLMPNGDIEISEETRAKANPTIEKGKVDPQFNPLGAYKLNLFDVIRHKSDTVLDDEPDAYVTMERNESAYTNAGDPFYEPDPSDSNYLLSTRSSIKIRQGSQRYVSILGGYTITEKSSLRAGLEGTTNYFQIGLLPLQRSLEPIELIFRVNVCVNRTDNLWMMDDEDETKKAVIEFSIFITISNSPVEDNNPALSDNAQVAVNNYLTKEEEDKALLEKTGKNKGNNEEVTNTPTGNKFRRSGITDISAANTGTAIHTTASTKSDEEQRYDLVNNKQLRLPLADGDASDSHYILLDSITNSTQIDFENNRTETNPNGINYSIPKLGQGTPSYNNYEYKPQTVSGINGPSYDYRTYFDLTVELGSTSPTIEDNSITKRYTQTLYLRPKKQTVDLPGGYFPLYFMVYDDFQGSSRGTGRFDKPITNEDILKGSNSENSIEGRNDRSLSGYESNIDGIVSRQIVCVFIYIVNSAPQAKRDTYRITASAGGLPVIYNLTSLISDLDIPTAMEDGVNRFSGKAKDGDFISSIIIGASASIDEEQYQKDSTQNGTQGFEQYLDIKKGKYQPDDFAGTKETPTDNGDSITPQTLQIIPFSRYGHNGRTIWSGSPEDNPYPLKNLPDTEGTKGHNNRLKVFTVYFFDSYATTEGVEGAIAANMYAKIRFEVYITNTAPEKTQVPSEKINGVDFEMQTGDAIYFILPFTTTLPDGVNYYNDADRNVKYVRPAIDRFDTPQDSLFISELQNNPLGFATKYSEHLRITRTGINSFNIVAEKPTYANNPVSLTFKVQDDEDEFNSVNCTYVISIKATPPAPYENNTKENRVYGVTVGKELIINLGETNEAEKIFERFDGYEIVETPLSQESGRPETKFSNDVSVKSAFVGQGPFLINEMNSRANKWIELKADIDTNGPIIRVKALNIYDQNITSLNYKNVIEFYVVDQYNNACLVELCIAVINSSISLDNPQLRRSVELDVVGQTTTLSMNSFIVDNEIEFQNQSSRYGMKIYETLFDAKEAKFLVASFSSSGVYDHYGPPQKGTSDGDRYYSYINEGHYRSMYDYFDLTAENGIVLGKHINFESLKRTPEQIMLEVEISKDIWQISADRTRAEKTTVELTILLSVRVRNSAPVFNQGNAPRIVDYLTNVSSLNLKKGEIATYPLYGTSASVAYLITDPDGDPIYFNPNTDVTVSNDSAGLFRACFDIRQEGENLVIEVLKKLQLPGETDSHYTRDITINAVDSSGTGTTTLFTFPLTISNTAPTSSKEPVREFELTVFNNQQFSDYHNDILVDVLPLEYFISDADIGTQHESYSISIGSSNIGVQNGYNITAQGEVIANIRAINNNTEIIVVGKSNLRGATSNPINVLFKDSSNGMINIFIVFKVGNTAPVAAETTPEISILNDGSTAPSRYIFFNEADHNASDFVQNYDFVPLVTDINLQDRFQYANYVSDITVRNREKPLVKIAEPTQVTGSFGFAFSLIPGAFGQERLTIRLYDSDPYDLSLGTLSVTVYLYINIAEAPKNLELSDYGADESTFFYECHYKSIKPTDIFKGVNSNGDSLAYGYTLEAGSFSQYTPGESLANPVSFLDRDGSSVSSLSHIQKNYGTNYASISSVMNTNSSSVNQTADEDEGFVFSTDDPIVRFYEKVDDEYIKGNSGTYLFAVRKGMTRVKAVLDVVGFKFDIVINIIVKENLKPVRKDDRIETGVFNITALASPYGQYGYVRLALSELFSDAEGDVLTLISATSTKKAIVEVHIVEEEDGLKVIHLVCKASGTAQIDITISDAKNVYYYNFLYINENLDSLSFFSSLLSDIIEDPSGLIAFIIIAVVLTVFLTIFIARRKKKKLLMAEIERQLINEMELEEQLLKLSAAAPNIFDALPEGMEKYTEIGSMQGMNPQIGANVAQQQIGQSDQMYLDSSENEEDYLQLDVGYGDSQESDPSNE